MPTPRAAARETLAILRVEADPRKARALQAFFKEPVRAFGLSTSRVRAIASDLHREVKGSWTVGDAVELCDLLLARPELEARGVAVLVLERFRNDYPESLFNKAHGWLAANCMDNWASVDVFCPDVVGALLEMYPRLVRRIEAWAASPNRWVRRASIVSFIKLARRKEYRDAIYGMARRHFSSDDDLIQKATGWLLREVGKQDMAVLEAFLVRHGPRIPRTTLRYAIERFPPGKRRDLLLATRGARDMGREHPCGER